MTVDLGIVGTEEEAVGAIVDALADFLRAGGVFSWGEWSQMSAATRAAAVTAGEAVDLERAQRLISEAVDVFNESDRAAKAESVFDEVEALL